MNEEQLKAQFAAFFSKTDPALSPHERGFQAARQLFPAEKDRGAMLMAAFHWPADPVVIAALAQMEDERPTAKGVPTKDEVIAEMWKQVLNDRTPAKDKAATARLVAEMLKYIPKQGEDENDVKRMPSAPVYKVVEE